MNTIPLQRGLTGWKHVKSQAMERYFGPVVTENLSRYIRDYYWPVYIAGTHGWVYAMPGGDFVGNLMTNGEMSVFDRADALIYRMQKSAAARRFRNKISIGAERYLGGIGGLCYAFATDDAVLAAETGGKMNRWPNNSKIGPAANAIGNAIDLWTSATQPVAGAAAGAAPGGVAYTSSSTGAAPYTNPASAETGHFRAARFQANVANMTLMMYDRLFGCAKTMNSTANEAVTGVPTRYQSAISTDDDYAGGNFLTISNPTTVLAATAHNWVAGGAGNGGCTFTNAAGTVGQNLLQVTGVSACVLRGVDIAANSPGWFAALGSGQVGIKALTKMECSALVATGTIDFIIGHGIAWIPCYAANMMYVEDGLYGAGPRLPHIEDNACLAFMEMNKSATTTTTYTGEYSTIGE